ncbi:hypothetical protein IAI10_06375 [Clostridium sp. 19966]|uniref:hypothetical protein n=1 Tax=Clostridium sp. 19966 TaxID=2768166 RepID=UPI0028DF5B79|nr:hypothetical protein [Clostridium sp. 19966]MDT8716276.1 hypothetical protein [Clostridium sp. 19966]
MSNELIIGQDVLSKSKKFNRRMIYGIVSILFGVFGFFDELTNKTEGMASGILLALIFIVVGIIVYRKASASKAFISRVRQYISMLQNDPNTEINHIAEISSQNSDLVKKDILKMIEERYIIGAYIDNQSNKVIFNNNEGTGKSEPNNRTFVTVKCSNCGAENQIKQGSTGECEYCGSPISDNQ